MSESKAHNPVLKHCQELVPSLFEMHQYLEGLLSPLSCSTYLELKSSTSITECLDFLHLISHSGTSFPFNSGACYQCPHCYEGHSEVCTSNQRLTSSDNCCLKFRSPCDNVLIQLPLKSLWLSLALRKWPFKCDLFSNNKWSLTKTNLRFFPIQHEMENQFLGALSSFVTNWFPDPCRWERGREKSTQGMANSSWVSNLLYWGHSPQVHVVVEFSSQRVHFCKQQTGIMASPQWTSQLPGTDWDQRSESRGETSGICCLTVVCSKEITFRKHVWMARIYLYVHWDIVPCKEKARPWGSFAGKDLKKEQF